MHPEISLQALINNCHARDSYRRWRVLVVGADGFLGFNFVRSLARLGSTVSILTRKQNSAAQAFAQKTYCGDLREWQLVRSAVEGQGLVIDLAGSGGAVDSNQNPEASLEHDCKPHLVLFRACAAVQPQPMVLFSSSRLVYGKPLYLPVDEEHPLRPQSMYAVHKITVENYLRVFGQTTELPYCILRLSNPYGPHQPENGKTYGIINRFLRFAARGEEIVIYGNGRQSRDYIYVDDVVAAFLLVATEERCCGEIYNLGGETKLSLSDAALQIAAMAGGTPVRYKPWPKEHGLIETGDYCTNSARLHSAVQMLPPTPWKAGLASSLEFYRKEAVSRGIPRRACSAVS